MEVLFIILIIIACIIMSFFILIQKPKGGGLNGSFGSIGTQVMGVKQSTDIMEKGTWYTIAIIAALSIAIVFQLPVSKQTKTIPNQETQQSQVQPTGEQTEQPISQ